MIETIMKSGFCALSGYLFAYAVATLALYVLATIANAFMRSVKIDTDEIRKLFMTNLTVANTLYILRKEFGMETAKIFLKKLCMFINIAPSTQEETKQAFDTPNPDFEDALQYFSAVAVHADVIITRNEKHFRFSDIPVMDARTYLEGEYKMYGWTEDDNTVLNEPPVDYGKL